MPEAAAQPVAPHEDTLRGVDFLAHVDGQLRFLYASDASLRFIGYHRDYLRTVGLTELVPSEEVPRLAALIERARTSGGVERDTLHLVKSLTYPTAVELRVVASAYGDIDGFAIAAFDVEAWRENESRLAHDLNHDALTGLASVAAFQHTLEQAAGRTATGRGATAGPAALAGFVIDLDNFQRINSALGYEAGDALLVETARRLQSCLAPQQRLARVGGDEFAILDPERGSEAELETFAKRLLAAVHQPYVWRGQPVRLSASIGVALYPSEDGTDARHLLRRAEQALAQAKLAGTNTHFFHRFEPDPARAERLKLEAELYDGVRNGEFSVHYQPISSSESRGVVGVEALIRWHHPKHGLVSPSLFVPLAESVGLINFLGDWVLKVACMQLTQWDAAGIALQFVSVNVSPQQFSDRRFVAAVNNALALTGVAPQRVILEITESVLMRDPAHAASLLRQLADIGIRFAVDDFGTGYSSLAHLQRFPLAKLKIDRSFIENLLTSRNDRAIVTAVVGLARNLNLRLVAEGVETEDQRALLSELGCHHIQGWLVCQALPPDELLRRFETRELHVHQEAR